MCLVSSNMTVCSMSVAAMPLPLLLLLPQVAEHCSQQGMQFLLAVRGCSQDNAVYTPVIPLNVQCNQMAQQGPGAAAAGAGAGALGGNALGLSALPGLSDAPAAQDKASQRRRGNSASAASGSFLAAAAAGLAAAALL
jgi:hypothetical protein